MAPADVSIRLLEAADLEAYKALRDETLAAFPSAFTSDAAEEAVRNAASYLPRLGLERPDGGHFTLGAWQRDALLGAIGCERDARAKVNHIGHLVGMMVAESGQRRGVGGVLLAGAIAEARRADRLVLLTLSVTADNAAAVRLYERFGFVRFGHLPRAIRVAGRYHAKDQMALTL